jgi:DNA-binding transcriptional MocR family regulator
MDPLFEIELELPPPGARGALKALYEQLKAAIEDGRLAPGARLPPTRRSEALLGVSRNTAAEVYERLVNDGYLVTRPGSGAYVAERSPGHGSRRPQTPAATRSTSGRRWSIRASSPSTSSAKRAPRSSGRSRPVLRASRARRAIREATVCAKR